MAPIVLSETSNGITSPKANGSSPPHPLTPLSMQEIDIAREVVLKSSQGSVVFFRGISLEEPPKDDLAPFLDIEHSGHVLVDTPRPARRATVKFDRVDDHGGRVYGESSIDVNTRSEVEHRTFGNEVQPSMSLTEVLAFESACFKSPLLQEALAQLKLPEGFVACIDPWPYGGPDPEESVPRYMQGLVFAKDTKRGKDSNFYGYPLPIIPVLDPSEYVPELLPKKLRADIKPLHILQPEGPSFTVSDSNLVQWQKWRFRIGFTPREGAVLHDIWYDGRSIMYRLSFSEMTVPYGDPRPPFHRKQAFDFGDGGGVGAAANNLTLGCDCLGVIKYLDAINVDSEGKPAISSRVVCLHEQDAGIMWKHTAFATNRSAISRSRELVVQFVVTLANYEYVFSYNFDQAAGINLETRATGAVSVVNIDPGKISRWGNVVAPGVLAQHHQHLFAVRMDPAIDGLVNTVVKDETLPLPMEPVTNPHGNGFHVQSTPITKSSSLDASPATNLTLKITNPSKLNPISRQPVSYKFTPSPSQLLLAHPDSVQAKRASFARHHVWITKYRDRELYAGGQFTYQSREERGGVADAASRDEDIENADVVVWSVFGMTHTPRVEDWPVMPMQKHELHIQPHDFFTENPAIDAQGAADPRSFLMENGNGEQQKSLPVVEQGEEEVTGNHF